MIYAPIVNRLRRCTRRWKRWDPSASIRVLIPVFSSRLLPGEFPRERLETLLAWHAADPPGEYEHHRNQASAEKQGNRNPLIDFPGWASRIDFRFGLD